MRARLLYEHLVLKGNNPLEMSPWGLHKAEEEIWADDAAMMLSRELYDYADRLWGQLQDGVEPGDKRRVFYGSIGDLIGRITDRYAARVHGQTRLSGVMAAIARGKETLEMELPKIIQDYKGTSDVPEPTEEDRETWADDTGHAMREKPEDYTSEERGRYGM